MDWREHIWIDPQRMHGVLCLRGTRIPVYVVLDNLAAGLDGPAIRAEYPSLSDDHIRAALLFAADLAHDRIISIPA